MQTESDLRVERSRREGRRVAQEGGLPELLDALRWRWRPTVLIAALFTVGATIYVESLPSQYDGKAVISIAPRDPATGPESVRVIGPKYPAYITASATVDQVAPTIGEKSK